MFNEHTRLLDIPEVCKRTTIGKTFLYKLINEGKLKPIKLGRKTVFIEQEINQFIGACVSASRLHGRGVTNG